MTEEIKERQAVEQDQVVMPFYILVDVSYSMHADMPALNSALVSLLNAIKSEPIVDDVAQVSIMTFSDDATVLTPMSSPSDIQDPPTLWEQGGTQFGIAFRCLAATIEKDISSLRSQGYRTYRPCAFFITDGEPSDEKTWHREFTEQLTYNRSTGVGMKRHPVFVPFGFRDANEQHMKQLAYPPDTGKWYLAKDTKIEEALKGITMLIMKTVMTSSQTAHPDVQSERNAPKPAVQLPDPAPSSQVDAGHSEYDPNYDPFEVF